ncbi:hypothetical protein FHS16_004339 [Paenibacillus endophyticus]|uniref:Uncharacterized protein n=1 Tax=Paenibacillus endophyticus TaxID=1294268 RepID=A0A7W5GCQ7_9BACL|nr:hypothetical protein [Paenibacillus endophyticus]
MQDIFMVVTLLVAFGLFYGFAAWCDGVTRQAGGERE